MHNAVVVMELLFSRKHIPEHYLDHELSGSEWGGARELHIGGDFLLVYKIDANKKLITFMAIGTHSELFG